MRRRTFLAAAALLAGGSLAKVWAAARRRLDRDKLLFYRSATGEVVPVQSIADWQKRRAEILAGMQEIMGKLPGEAKRCPLDLKVEEEVDEGTFVRRLITYAAEPNSRVPAYLLIPKPALAGKPARAVLCLHPTDNQFGHKVVVGLGGKEASQYARELTERGYVTLAPAYPQLANYQPDLEKLGYASGTMKAIWDNMRGLDLLESLPFVRRGKFAAIGHSLGGHNALFTAAFEPRVAAVASSCGFDSFLDYYSERPSVWQRGNGWTQTRYMPRLADYAGRLEEIPFDFHEVIAVIAPRHCFVSAPTGDSNFKWKSAAAVVTAAAPVFQLHGAADNLRIEHPDTPHEFSREMREKAYLLFDRVLA